MWDTFLFVVLGTLALALVFYLLIPLVVWRMVTLRINGVLHDIDVSQISEEDLQYFHRVQAAVQPLGFVPVGYITTKGMSKQCTIIFLLFANPQDQAGCMASAVYVIHGTADQKTQPVRHSVEFSTDYASGLQFNTTTSLDAATPDIGPNKKLLILPSVTDPAQLYRYHQSWLNEQTGLGMRKPIPLDKTPHQMLSDEIHGQMRDKASRGWWTIDNQGNCQMTLKHAYLGTWTMLWPLKSICRARKIDEGKALMQRADGR